MFYRHSLLLLCLLFLSLPIHAQDSWTRCSNGLPTAQILSLAKAGSTLFAGTDTAGVYRSTDNGVTWTISSPLTKLMRIQTWCMTTIDTFVFAAHRGSGIFRMGANGTAWTEVNTDLTSKMVNDIIAVGHTLYAASYGKGVFVSIDMGEHWSLFHGNAGLDDMKIYALAANSTTLFAGTNGDDTGRDTGVAFRASFDGDSWEKINTGFIRNGAHLEQVLSLDANDSLVYAGTDDVGLFRSSDRGDHWEQISTYSGDIHSIKIVGSRVYYGTTYSGVFSSDDFGMTFHPNSNGIRLGNATLPYLVKDFLVDGSTIYAATDIGVFKQSLAASAAPREKETSEMELQVKSTPNPCTESSTIEYSIPWQGLVDLRVFDPTGREIKTLVYTEQPVGVHSVLFDVHNLDAGCYLYTLKLDGKFRLRTVTVIK